MRETWILGTTTFGRRGPKRQPAVKTRRRNSGVTSVVKDRVRETCRLDGTRDASFASQIHASHTQQRHFFRLTFSDKRAKRREAARTIEPSTLRKIGASRRIQSTAASRWIGRNSGRDNKKEFTRFMTMGSMVSLRHARSKTNTTKATASGTLEAGAGLDEVMRLTSDPFLQAEQKRSTPKSEEWHGGQEALTDERLFAREDVTTEINGALARGHSCSTHPLSVSTLDPLLGPNWRTSLVVVRVARVPSTSLQNDKPVS